MPGSLNERFNERYAGLNVGQRQAVDQIDGPVMVIAGPGTGKTTILTLRIANILKRTDTPPDTILALTFTESGVRAMRRKLSDIVGPAAYRVRIHTFHSFANDIIKAYPDRFPRIIGAEHVEGLEQIALVEKLVEKGDDTGHYDLLRPKGDPTYYVAKIISAIKDLKRDDVSPTKLSTMIDAEEKAILGMPDLRHDKGKYAGRIKGEYQDRLDDVAKNRELARAYAAYEKALEESRLYDFEDMIIEVVKSLRTDRDLCLRIQEESQYILADEHQDANTAQNELLELVSSFHDDPNLFIVGDEKQAIFRFQGASLENFLYFKRRFPKAVLIRLTDNYRSHQTILDAAHALIGNNQVSDESLRVELLAKGDHGLREGDAPGALPRAIDCVALPDIESELAYVAGETKKLLDQGIQPREIAVLIRNNRHAEAVERTLSSQGIPVARFADADVLDHPYAQAFLAVIRTSLDPAQNDLAGKALLAPFLGLDIVAVSRALNDWRKAKGLLIDFLKDNDATKSVANLFTRFGRMASSDPAVDAFEAIANESGFVEFIVKHPRSRELVPLYAALLSTVVRFAERERSATLRDLMIRLDHAREHGYSIAASSVPPEGVQLMTSHGSKGLEFEYVFIVHATDNVWGGKQARRAFKLPQAQTGTETDHGAALAGADSEDERRLFYVALTRARKHVCITYAERDSEGKELSPSRFTLEIPEAHIKRSSHATAKGIMPRAATVTTLFKDPAYIRQLFIERGFSVTHLNNFLECPWQYFFLNLILLPKAQENAQLYGSAIHGALHDYFEAYKREDDMSIDDATGLFEKYLRRTHMTERDLRDYTESGREELRTYLSSYEFPRAIWNEYKVSGVPFAVGDTEIVLNGNLDKVELVADGSVNVVDYKTGKPQSRNKLEGKTKDADGNYKRQLVFYKLIIDRYKAGEWKMATGTLDFIKPDDGGKLRREVFSITDEEVRELEGVIADAAKKILNAEFEGCAGPDCEWCRLAEIVEENGSRSSLIRNS
ncbi:MAG TPA: ATP-dependent DNA helicase [Candidatus Paceibacterota bacterium]|nr:ATP-dependent DNA helicase [Candidatus Paceibacterota bacterium]